MISYSKSELSHWGSPWTRTVWFDFVSTFPGIKTRPLSSRYVLDSRSSSTAPELLSPWFCLEYLWWVASYLLPGSHPRFPAASNCPHSHLQTEAHSSVTKGERRWSQKGFKKERESFYISKRETVFGEESYLCISSFSLVKGRVGTCHPFPFLLSLAVAYPALCLSQRCQRQASRSQCPWNCEICHMGGRYFLLTSQGRR